jgi:hypothetical protein
LPPSILASLAAANPPVRVNFGVLARHLHREERQWRVRPT